MLPARVDSLGYGANGTSLLQDLSFELTPGTKTVVMGANGAGKSLLLRLLHGLLTPDRGEIRWGGQPFVAAHRLAQAMVFQRPVLLRRSVRSNIKFVLRLRGQNADAARVQDILDQVSLGALAGQPARRLSGGEQQRLALARAMALEPAVLFLDEPSANLDPASTAAIERIIDQFHAAGTKVVLVTHDIGQAHRVADDVIFLSQGQLTEHTPADRFFNCPSSESAADYLAGKLVY